jgi:hypothetical protein
LPEFYQFRFWLDLACRGVLTNHVAPPNECEICLAVVVPLRFAALNRQLS